MWTFGSIAVTVKDFTKWTISLPFKIAALFGSVQSRSVSSGSGTRQGEMSKRSASERKRNRKPMQNVPTQKCTIN